MYEVLHVVLHSNCAHIYRTILLEITCMQTNSRTAQLHPNTQDLNIKNTKGGRWCPRYHHLLRKMLNLAHLSCRFVSKYYRIPTSYQSGWDLFLRSRKKNPGYAQTSSVYEGTLMLLYIFIFLKKKLSIQNNLW